MKENRKEKNDRKIKIKIETISTVELQIIERARENMSFKHGYKFSQCRSCSKMQWQVIPQRRVL